MNFLVLTPLIASIAVTSLSARGARKEAARPADTEQGDVEIYRAPQGSLGFILFLAIALPTGAFLLPDSVVLDARPLFNVTGIAACSLFLWCWLYFKRYQIALASHTLTYGAFRSHTIDLNRVTRIRYHWVNNGKSLKLFAGKKRIGIFEGDVEHFDAFAKEVRRRVPIDAIAETKGQASF